MNTTSPVHRPRGRLRRGISACTRVVGHTAESAWDHSIFSKAATAAFWQTLSLPPLLLGLLGSLGYVAGWFGPDTVDIVMSKIVTFTRTAFSDSVVDQIIAPTVEDVLGRGRADVMSLGFVLSLWAGSSAISTFVDSIVEAHGQQDHRHPVWQRVFGLLLYVMFLVLAVFTLPLVALGPTMIGRLLPHTWYAVGERVLDTFYYPAVLLLLLVGLTTLYKVALPRSLPWHRLLGGAVLAGVFFVLASAALRRYLTWITDHGYSYGALAAPIAFLLFTFFLGFAIIIGAELNATVQSFWPARATRIEQWRDWLAAQADKQPSPELGPVTNLTRRITLASPIRLTDLLKPDDPPSPSCPIDGHHRCDDPSDEGCSARDSCPRSEPHDDAAGETTPAADGVPSHRDGPPPSQSRQPDQAPGRSPS
ncbi:MAG: YihY/virulence factor BrkB family protein [Rhodococcus sp.]|uniref:YihY/virulence factor BrkB family protein n=1 Tax=Rhodococcus TaxID=1827 RepID=UPI001690A263|nr:MULTISPECIES: YihY/virulence factor BrkB family protein [Rhodococcus]NLV80860.1 YihY/virulence factor BrkB family protein [Rhodococcus sp. (in: high G+C Gram-positive bacteria)]